MNFFRNVFRRVGTPPPEPLPSVAQVPREGLPPTVRELASSDRRLIILISQDNEKIFRGHCFTWFTHADDGVWNAFWTHRDLGLITDDFSVALAEADRQMDVYEETVRIA